MNCLIFFFYTEVFETYVVPKTLLMNFIVGFVQSPIFKDINTVTTGNRLVLRAKECHFSSVLILFKQNSTLYDLAFIPIIIHSS